MINLEPLSPGNRVELQLSQQVLRAKNTGEKVHTFISDVTDIFDNGTIEVEVPTEKGRLIPLPVGIRVDVIFFVKTSLYGCRAVIKDRYKKDNLYMLLLTPETDIYKVQRREFFRVDVFFNLDYYVLQPEDLEMEKVEDIYQFLKEQGDPLRERQGVAADLSGGGIRFTGDIKLEKEAKLLMCFPLPMGGQLKQFLVIGEVIDSFSRQDKYDTFVNRVKFQIEDNRVREHIIRYVFEEERRQRKRENGQ